GQGEAHLVRAGRVREQHGGERQGRLPHPLFPYRRRRTRSSRDQKRRRPGRRVAGRAFGEKIRRRPTLPHGDHAVPSALEGLTAVFGMGTGVAPPLSPPETGSSSENLDGKCREQTRGSSRQAKNYGQAARPFSTG